MHSTDLEHMLCMNTNTWVLAKHKHPHACESACVSVCMHVYVSAHLCLWWHAGVSTCKVCGHWRHALPALLSCISADWSDVWMRTIEVTCECVDAAYRRIFEYPIRIHADAWMYVAVSVSVCIYTQIRPHPCTFPLLYICAFARADTHESTHHVHVWWDHIHKVMHT